VIDELAQRGVKRTRAAKVADRDEGLLRVLHDEHAQALWAHAMRLCDGDRARAEDLVQETLLRAWRNPPDLDPTRGSIRAWLLTTARRLAIDAWRHSAVRPEVITDRPPEIAVPDPADRTLQSWLVSDALAELSPNHRAVIEECFFRERSVQEAADVLGVPVGTVKSRTHYALRALRLILSERGVTTA
jgi:RNA polymerase sigma-70 factor (ECF subfamily)